MAIRRSVRPSVRRSFRNAFIMLFGLLGATYAVDTAMFYFFVAGMGPRTRLTPEMFF